MGAILFNNNMDHDVRYAIISADKVTLIIGTAEESATSHTDDRTKVAREFSPSLPRSSRAVSRLPREANRNVD